MNNIARRIFAPSRSGNAVFEMVFKAAAGYDSFDFSLPGSITE